jgi:FKBP-type peptidyl-prolyl cis-trans isomerase
MTKKIAFTVLLVVIMVLACYAGGKSEKSGAPPAGNSSTTAGNSPILAGNPSTPAVSSGKPDYNTSYAFGLILAESSNLKIMELDFDYDAVIQGFKDSVEWNTPKISIEEAFSLAQNTIVAAMEQLAVENKAREEQFFAENGKKAGVATTASGLQYRVDKAGAGRKPAENDIVSVHYEGSFLNGKVFDSSYDQGEPMEFTLGEAQLIQGWLEGIRLMTVGSIYTFYIPSSLAYGEDGGRGAMPPSAALIFKVELLSAGAEGE